MVKLIRLQTTNTDAHFKASFDNDITIKENSKIALKNLTFESDFATFNPSMNNAYTNFLGNATVPSQFFSQSVENKTYTKSDELELENEVNQSFNRTISISDGRANDRGHAELYGQFKLSRNNFNKYMLEFRQSRAMNIIPGAYNSLNFFTGRFPDGSSAGGTGVPYPDDQGPFEEGTFPLDVFDFSNKQELKLKNAAVAVTDERYSFVARTGLGISKGAGVFYCRIKSSVAAGAGVGNGFSFGISYGDPRTQDDQGLNDSRDTVRNIEITYKDPATNYFFRKTNKGVASVDIDSNVAPNLVNGGALNAHDVLIFKIDNNPNNIKCISAHIITSAGGGNATEHLLFEKQIADDELNGVLTPYIYMRGKHDKIVLDMLRFTPDPFYVINKTNIMPFFDPIGDDQPDDPVAILVADTDPTHEFNFNDPAVIAPTDAMRDKITIYYPTINGNSLDFIHANTPIPSLAIAGGLAEVLGFNKLGDTSEFLRSVLDRLIYKISSDKEGKDLNSFGFEIYAEFSSLFDFNDSYIVESMTLPLLSYNSSVDKNNRAIRNSVQTLGSRRNILATIPHSGIGNGLVQYEPNEMVYIDINNSQKLNIRNLEFRILDNNFQPIRIIGETDMCLLID